MMKHYFILAWRNLRIFSINILTSFIGLILGISTGIFLILYLLEGIESPKIFTDKSIIIILFIIFIIVGGIIYINLYSFITIRRSKEIAIRKTLGANKKDLFKQFFIDSLLRIILTLLISLTLIDLMLPVINIIMNHDISLKSDFNYKIILMLLLMILFYSWLGGIYVKLNFRKFKQNFL